MSDYLLASFYADRWYNKHAYIIRFFLWYIMFILGKLNTRWRFDQKKKAITFDNISSKMAVLNNIFYTYI